MKKEPVKVSLIGVEKDYQGSVCYQIQFPNLKIPVNVNEELYQKMVHSSQYSFENEILNTFEKQPA